MIQMIPTLCAVGCAIFAVRAGFGAARAHRAAARAAASAALAWVALERIHRAALLAHTAGLPLTLDLVTEIVAGAALVDRANRTDD